MYDYKVIAKEIKVFLSAEELFVYTPASEPLEIRNTFVWLIPRTARCMRRGEKECDGVSHVIVMPWRCARLRRKKTNCFFASFLFLWQHVSLDVLEWFCTLDFYLFFISIEKVVQRIHTGITSTTFLFFSLLLDTWCDEIPPSWFLYCRWKLAAGRNGKSFNLMHHISARLIYPIQHNFPWNISIRCDVWLRTFAL